MAKEWGTIPDHLAQFAMSQKVFFVASVAGEDDVNLSPKGVSRLKVIDEKTVVYADYHGSGDQTSKHLSAGGKATLVFMSFDEKPLIVRFYSKGRIVDKGAEEFDKLAGQYYSGLDRSKFRRIFIFDVYRVQTSCGYGVPVMEYKKDRSSQPYFKELYVPFEGS